MKNTVEDKDKLADKLQEGEIIVTNTITPDWDPVLKKSSGIITAVIDPKLAVSLRKKIPSLKKIRSEI